MCERTNLYGGPYPFIQTGEISNAKGRITNHSQTYSELGLSQSKLWPAGTLCITIAANIAKTAVLTFPACFPDSVVGFIPYDIVNTDFIRYWFLTIQSRLEEEAPQAAQKNINLKILGDLSVPLSPLTEQERIVKLLNEADELRKLRAQADLRTAILIPALFHQMSGDPATNTKGWPVKSFGKLVRNQDGRRKPVKASDREGRQGEFPYYGASGIIDYVDEFIFDERALLIGEDGANLLARSTPIAFIATNKYWVNNHAHVLTENENADLDYLCTALNMRDLKDYITGSAQPKLNQANMNRISIPVPPLPLQKEFAQRVTEIRALEAEQAASRTRLDALFQSLLHRAFNGEL